MNDREKFPQWNLPQTMAAIADAFERCAALARRGQSAKSHMVMLAVDILYRTTEPAEGYFQALRLADVSESDARSAVAAISEGRHPPDSLPGRVVEAIKPAFAVYNAAPSTGSGEARGKLEALNNALRWIGVMR